MTREEFLAALAELHRQWSGKWAGTEHPDPAYAGAVDSQYPEHALEMDAPVEAEREFLAAALRLRDEYYASLEL